MPVTEVAILPLAPGLSASSPELLSDLRRGKAVQEKYSGAWESPSAHQEFIATPDNQSLLKALEERIQLKKIIMYHLKLDINATPLPLDAPTISINRRFIREGQQAAFEKVFVQAKPLLQAYTKPMPVAGGWRVEKEGEGKEEWVSFSGFDSVDHHHGFAKTPASEKYREVVQFAEGFEVKHLERLAGV